MQEKVMVLGGIILKKYDLIYYWKNYLMNQDEIDIKPNAYILKLSLINYYSRDLFCNWYSFSTAEELIGFIKFVAIPSIYVTKVFGKEESTIFLDALYDYETIEVIKQSDNSENDNILKEIEDDYDFIDKLQNKFSIERVKKFVNNGNYKKEKDLGIFSKLEFFENVNEIGRELVREFENENMLAELEKNMDLKKNQILALFDGIDKNPFMIRRIGTYLNNKLAF